MIGLRECRNKHTYFLLSWVYAWIAKRRYQKEVCDPERPLSDAPIWTDRDFKVETVK